MRRMIRPTTVTTFVGQFSPFIIISCAFLFILDLEFIFLIHLCTICASCAKAKFVKNTLTLSAHQRSRPTWNGTGERTKATTNSIHTPTSSTRILLLSMLFMRKSQWAHASTSRSWTFVLVTQWPQDVVYFWLNQCVFDRRRASSSIPNT